MGKKNYKVYIRPTNVPNSKATTINVQACSKSEIFKTKIAGYNIVKIESEFESHV